MLDWSLGKFRDERQGPLLERAATRFAGLTLGAFDGLVVDEEGGRPQLRGRRPDRSYVDSREMSEGTCDQLYLALRVAGWENVRILQGGMQEWKAKGGFDAAAKATAPAKH